MEEKLFHKVKELGRFSINVGLKKKLSSWLVFLIVDLVVRAMGFTRENRYVLFYLNSFIHEPLFDNIPALVKLRGFMKEDM